MSQGRMKWNDVSWTVDVSPVVLAADPGPTEDACTIHNSALVLPRHIHMSAFYPKFVQQ